MGIVLYFCTEFLRHHDHFYCLFRSAISDQCQRWTDYISQPKCFWVVVEVQRLSCYRAAQILYIYLLTIWGSKREFSKTWDARHFPLSFHLMHGFADLGSLQRERASRSGLRPLVVIPQTASAIAGLRARGTCPWGFRFICLAQGRSEFWLWWCQA